MYVSREKLLENGIQYEKAKLKDTFSSTPNLLRTLKLGRMMMGKILEGNSKPVQKKRIAVNKWMKYLTMEQVTRRIYSGVPDRVSFNTDFFCSLLLCGDMKVFEAIGLLGHLIRYGYWNSDSCLMLDGDSSKTFSAELGITEKEFTSLMRKIHDHELLIHVVEYEGKEMFKLNPDLVVLLNEKENYFVRENHKTKQQ